MNNQQEELLGVSPEAESLSPVVAAQLAREEAATVNGITRYTNAANKAESSGAGASTAPNVKLVKSLIEPCAEEIQKWAEGQMTANRSAFRGRVVLALGPFHAAYLACQHIIGNFGENLNAVVHELGADIEDNLNLAVALKLDSVGPLIKHLQKTKYKGGNKREVAKGLDAARRRGLKLPKKHEIRSGAAEDTRVESEDAIVNVALSGDEKATIGHALIDIVVNHIARGFTYGDATGGLFEIVNEQVCKRGKYETVQKIYPTALYLEYKASGHKAVEALRPVYENMHITPLSWTTPDDGGYLSIRLQAVKGGRPNFLKDAHATGKLQPLYDALNTLQQVGWKYNSFVAETMQQVWNAQMNTKCWPRFDMEPPPAMPAGCAGNEEAFKQSNMKAWFKWKEEASAVKRRNASKSRITKLDAIDNRINYALAAVATGNPTFYEVWQADFRLRLYPVSTIINSQGDDMSKSLMLFSEGKAIDERGAYWLRIQLANAWANDKLDKKLFEVREQWVLDNEERIFQAGTDPMADLWWMGADKGKKPWGFLAACREYAGWMKEGVGYVSHLPMSLDGSCNGIQHYSATMRDEHDGALVNLVYNGAPQDLYAAVVKATQERLALIAAQALTSTGDDEKDKKALYEKQLAALWGPQVNRDCTKRPAMTYGYSATLPTFKDQIAVEAEDLFEGLTRNERRDAVGCIASAVDKGIKTTVSSAAKGMGFLQTLAHDIGSRGLPVVWETPDGCIVQQDYKQFAEKRVRTILNGSIKLRADKAMLVQQDLLQTPGFNLEWTPEGVSFETKTEARKVVRAVKAECIKKSAFNFYRSEVVALLETYTVEDYNFKGLAELVIEKRSLVFTETEKAVFVAALKMVIKHVMAMRHLRELDTEEVDEETGEVTQKRGSITIAEPTAEIDVKKMTRGIGPNFIHSLDAAHLRMTVARLAKRGVTSLMMVHDSYGCHAADVDIMAHELREAFIDIHVNPRLEVFGEEMVAKGYLNEETFKEARAKWLQYGDLDIQEVRNSPYFFG